MEIVRTTFNDRVNEIKTYFSYLAFIETGLNSGSVNFKLGEITHSITPTLQKTLYAGIYLHLYNLVESTITLLLKAAEKKIKDDVSENGISILRTEVKQLWIRYMAGTHDTLGPEIRLEKALNLCDYFIESVPFELEIPKGGGGNWDNENIRTLAKRMGLILTIPRQINTDIKKPIKDNKGIIQLITYTRNKLAHGEISFSECGGELTASNIEQFIKTTISYLDAVINCFDIYLNQEQYKESA